jgi:hypothetical protein
MGGTVFVVRGDVSVETFAEAVPGFGMETKLEFWLRCRLSPPALCTMLGTKVWFVTGGSNKNRSTSLGLW